MMLLTDSRTDTRTQPFIVKDISSLPYLSIWSPVLVHKVRRSSDKVIHKLRKRRVVRN